MNAGASHSLQCCFFFVCLFLWKAQSAYFNIVTAVQHTGWIFSLHTTWQAESNSVCNAAAWWPLSKFREVQDYQSLGRFQPVARLVMSKSDSGFAYKEEIFNAPVLTVGHVRYFRLVLTSVMGQWIFSQLLAILVKFSCWENSEVFLFLYYMMWLKMIFPTWFCSWLFHSTCHMIVNTVAQVTNKDIVTLHLTYDWLVLFWRIH